MNYELQLWNGAEYQRHETHPDPAELRGIYKRNFTGGYRIVNRQREIDGTTLPLKPRANWGTSKRRSQADAMPIRQQAELAAEHYQFLRNKQSLAMVNPQDPVKVPVYPVKPSGRGVAAEFRSELARILTGQLPMTRGVLWNKTIDETRRILESRLPEAGFEFVEVDLEDYPS